MSSRKKTTGVVILVWVNMLFFYQMNDYNTQLKIQDIKHKRMLDIVLKKYHWKTDRLREYTDLVYNTNNGVVYGKK